MLYTTGPITDIVYGVEGGMEDWAYGAGWENEVIICKILVILTEI